VLIFQVSKNNRKRRTAIISHQKILIIAKKIKSIGPSLYRFSLALRNNYRKMSSMRLPPLVLRLNTESLNDN